MTDDRIRPEEPQVIFVNASGSRQRSDYWAGVVIVVLVFLCLLTMVRVNDQRMNPSNMVQYQVEFDLASGVEGVTPGSLVYYGGIEVGWIESVSYRNSILTVKTLIQDQFRLHPGATVTRAGSLIGGKASFVIESTGNKDKEPLPSGSIIKGANLNDGASLIVGRKNAEHLASIRRSLSQTSDDYSLIEPDLKRFRDTRDALEDFSAIVKSDMEKWNPKIEAIQSRLDSISPRLSTAGEDLAKMNDSAGTVIDDANQLSALFTDERFEKLKNDFEQAMASYEELSSTFDKEIVPKTEYIVKTMKDSEGRAEEALATLQRMSGEGRRTMQLFVANSTLAAQELIIAQNEILSTLGLSLLEHPTELDVEFMVREEALQMWARTAIRIQLLLSAVESMKIEPGKSKSAEEILKRLRGELQNTLDDYLKIQKQIFSSTDQPVAATE